MNGHEQKAARTVFITGGARSGKSSFALREAAAAGNRKVFLATAESLDEEMADRIARHREERGGDWDTIEEPLQIEQILRDVRVKYDAVVVDCLTLWVSNLMQRNHNVAEKTDKLVDTLRDRNGQAGTVILVSNEVGMGIVPDNELARQFRDNAGMVNQKIAQAADEVYIVASGIPVRIK